MEFLKFITRVAGVLTEPKDWRFEQKDNFRTFKGNFLVYDRNGGIRHRVLGQIIEWERLPAQVYIYDPPQFVKNHRHGSCLQLLRPNEKWFKLHFDRPATDFATAYTYVEHFLTEAYNLKN